MAGRKYSHCIIVFALLLGQSYCNKFAMNHAYLTRMIAELPSLCPHVKTCLQSSPNDKYISLNYPPAEGQEDWIHSCCSYCYCGQWCEKYRQCCPETLLELYTDGELVDEIAFECELPHFKLPIRDTRDRVNLHDGILMTDVCDESGVNSQWNEDERMKCERRNISNIDEMIPVVSENTRVRYVNKYCSNCNDDTNIVSWHAYIGLVNRDGDVAEMRTYGNLHWTDIYKLSYDPDSELNMYFKSPLGDEDTDSCLGPVITECNATGLWQNHDPFYEFACKVYRSNYLLSDENWNIDVTFGNVFCAVCNGFPAQTAECQGPIRELNEPGYLALINYEEKTDITSNFEDGRPVDDACPDTDFRDPLNERCRPWLCPKGYYYNGVKCIASITGLLGGNLLFIVKIHPITIQPSISDLEQLDAILTNDVLLVDAQPHLKTLRAFKSRNDGANGEPTELVLILNTQKVQTGKLSNHYVDAFLDTIATIPKRSVQLQETNVTFRVELANNVKLENIAYNLDNVAENFTLVNINDGKNLVNIYRPLNQRQLMKNSIVVVKKVDFCTSFYLSKVEYIAKSNCSIEIVGTDVVFYCTEYEVEEADAVRLCVDDYIAALAVEAHSNASQLASLDHGVVMMVTLFACASTMT